MGRYVIGLLPSSRIHHVVLKIFQEKFWYNVKRSRDLSWKPMEAKSVLYILYLSIAIAATTIGSMTGMGGGVIMKPLMDVLKSFDVETIGMLSSITVFFMSVVSVGKQMLAKTPIPFDFAVPLAFGSVVGGYLGQWLLRAVVTALHAQSLVTVVQNVLLAILILGVYLYMRRKDRIQGKHLSGIPVSLLTGCILGICSAFLGIGGGPIDVAVIIYLYSTTTKTATICSLLIILFSQVSKLATVALTTGFAVYDLSVAPVMVIGAIAGGFIGAAFNRRCSEETVEKAFNAVQLLVLAIAVFNIVRNLISAGA